jgi:nitrogen fixation NifU-like protein
MKSEHSVFDDIEGLVVEEARKIYSEKVMDHFMNPRNFGAMKAPDGLGQMSGICGDAIAIYVGIEDGQIARISFVTDGCGPTVACSSAITCMAKGSGIQDAMRITGILPVALG